MEVYEFLVPGRPASVHEKNRAKFRKWIDDLVSAAAAASPGYMPFEYSLARLTIVFLCREKDRVDVDNVIKPIQNALERVYYRNDEMVSDVDAHRRFWTDDLERQRLPGLLKQAWKNRRDCLYVRIQDAQRLEKLI